MQDTFFQKLNGSFDEILNRKIERLRRGQKWLTERYAGLIQRVENGSFRPGDDELFSKSISEWAELEGHIRRTYKWSGCVIGSQGCDLSSPVVCDYCAAGRPEEVSQSQPALFPMGANH